jgi:outer membrane protein TolC
MLLLILLGMTATTHGQIQLLTLDSCYALARMNYPLIGQIELITRSADYSIENASKAYYPQISINGQATYQSDVTQIPVKLPNLPEISKDQYKVYVDLNQTLYDGGAVSLQKDYIQAVSMAEKQNVEVELYKVRDRVNQIYFSILLLDAQLQQSRLLQDDLKTGINKVHAAVVNGTALRMQEDVLQAEYLKADQRIVELNAARKAYLEMLGLFIGRSLDMDTKLEMPAKPIVTTQINRPELLYFDYRNKLLDVQQKQIEARMKPRVGFFIQGGYGRPALNMLNNDFDSYYIGGVRFSWSLTGFYTSKFEKAILGVNYHLMESQRQTFLMNTQIQVRQLDVETRKFQDLLKTDEEIIQLRSRIRTTALAQFENGVINANDYLRELNAEDQAKQNRLLHEIQMLMSSYRQQMTTGN